MKFPFILSEFTKENLISFMNKFLAGLCNNRHWSEELLPTTSLLFSMNFFKFQLDLFPGAGVVGKQPSEELTNVHPASRQAATEVSDWYKLWVLKLGKDCEKGCDAFLFFRGKKNTQTNTNKQKAGYCFTRRRMGSHGLRPLPVPSASWFSNNSYKI